MAAILGPADLRRFDLAGKNPPVPFIQLTELLFPQQFDLPAAAIAKVNIPVIGNSLFLGMQQ